jgi:hypothetical protein
MFPARPINAHRQRARRAGCLDVLDRVQLAGHPLEIQHSEVIVAHGFRRQLAHRRGWAGRPPIEKLADLGIKLGHGTPLYGRAERGWARCRFRRRASATTTCARTRAMDEGRLHAPGLARRLLRQGKQASDEIAAPQSLVVPSGRELRSGGGARIRGKEQPSVECHERRAVRPVADSSVAGSSASIAEVKFGRAGLTPARRSATE